MKSDPVKQIVAWFRESRKGLRTGIEAGVRAGRALAELKKGEPGPRLVKLPATVAGISDYARAVKEAQISERTAQRWQQAGKMTDPQIEKYLKADDEPTLTGLINSKNPMKETERQVAAEQAKLMGTTKGRVKVLEQMEADLDLDPIEWDHAAAASFSYEKAREEARKAWAAEFTPPEVDKREVKGWLALVLKNGKSLLEDKKFSPEAARFAAARLREMADLFEAAGKEK
jgi:murein L,D-transpeptidase YcbB/YkuD